MKNMKNDQERGNAILEFAIGFTVLWFLFAGIFQFGYAFWAYNVLMTQVGNAAELGSKMTYDSSDPSSYTTKLQNMVLYGDTSAGTSPVVPNLTASNVVVNLNTDNNNIPRDITIYINGYTINALFTTFSPTKKPRATVLFVGRLAGY